MKISSLHTEYKDRALDEAQVDSDPFRQFARWFDEAVKAEMPEPNATTLATVVGKVDAAESDTYFAERPRASQLGAWASPQSEAVAGRALLETRFAAVEEAYRDAGDGVARPPHWGGYRVVPRMLEFWQGRRSRMHDRIRYRQSPDPKSWIIERPTP